MSACSTCDALPGQAPRHGGYGGLKRGNGLGRPVRDWPIIVLFYPIVLLARIALFIGMGWGGLRPHPSREAFARPRD